MYPWKWFTLGIALLSVISFVPSLNSTEPASTSQELIADRGHHGGRHGHHSGRNYRHYDNWGSRYYFHSTPTYYYRRTYYYPNDYYYYYSDPYYYYYPERRSGVYFRFGW
ncbi:putative secreted protein [Estrella lausannensis]|uniref:Putative secreted protein n=1 Tax=Estrella lausannensis TaxID=483423 RepID=A0A0H5DS80_9BACT|nr:putative secreted protein [Estrella lausannensis]